MCSFFIKVAHRTDSWDCIRFLWSLTPSFFLGLFFVSSHFSSDPSCISFLHFRCLFWWRWADHPAAVSRASFHGFPESNSLATRRCYLFSPSIPYCFSFAVDFLALSYHLCVVSYSSNPSNASTLHPSSVVPFSQPPAGFSAHVHLRPADAWDDFASHCTSTLLPLSCSRRRAWAGRRCGLFACRREKAAIR